MTKNTLGIEVAPFVEPVRFGGEGGQVVGVPAAAAFHDSPGRPGELLVVVPGLLTSRSLPEQIAERYAGLTGMDTLAFRSEVGDLTDPMRQVPDRYATVANHVIGRVRANRPGTYSDRDNVVAQSAGNMAGAMLLRQGSVKAYVALNAVMIGTRDRFVLDADHQAHLDSLPFPERAEEIYKLTDAFGMDGEDRTHELLFGFFKNCTVEMLNMLRHGNFSAINHANRGVMRDMVPNLRRSIPRRELEGSRLPRWFRQSRFVEAFRLASSDMFPEVHWAQEEAGTSVGAVVGIDDPIAPYFHTYKARHRFNAFAAEDAGHPLMTSKPAEVTDASAARMITQLVA